jgi:aerobic carbon-monoxide dehydrogenase medium subunit
MPTFELTQAESLEHALELRQQHGDDAHLIAGGTSLMVLMNLGLLEPSHLISLRKLQDLHVVHATRDGGLSIGAMVTHRQLETSNDVRTLCPALSETFGHVATIRIRNQGTLGGNLAHADPAQDPPPMLIALDAEVVLKSKAGQRSVPVSEFFVGYLTSVLRPDEVLTEIRVPPLAAGTRATYRKFLPRTQDDYATVSVAASLRMHNGRCDDVRVALGGAASTPLRATPVEDALKGEELTDQRITEAASLVLDIVDPPDDARGSADYKRRMARVWTERALRQLRDEAPA